MEMFTESLPLVMHRVSYIIRRYLRKQELQSFQRHQPNLLKHCRRLRTTQMQFRCTLTSQQAGPWVHGMLISADVQQVILTLWTTVSYMARIHSQITVMRQVHLQFTIFYIRQFHRSLLRMTRQQQTGKAARVWSTMARSAAWFLVPGQLFRCSRQATMQMISDICHSRSQ